ncbi:ABC transporter substrate-binding protein [Pusillimonas sp. ANT_WB101]|uniref:ABC transporter substrate-binding protein n=1 Tax=Pusillimonas sp. ANT_WB101 TaxID=2597356 RepID=UPI0011F07C78|nr:ABC transporter substrate-binding protein [Pusillimonas sp. ANT_WB101]KAA0892732.1 ABC transporter substrate-binding protein [Pusillimonas sp. ANT_WB101]
MKPQLRLALFTVGTSLAVALGGISQAQTLTIALSSEPTAADPHYHKQTQNDALAAHVFESLINRTADMKMIPGLATSWENVDDLTWKLKLREGVNFSNGKPFTAQDVLFSICRTLNNKGNISASYTTVTKLLTDVQTPDDHTVILKTAEPFPLMPAELARQLPVIWNGIVEHGALTFAPKEGCGVTGPWPAVADFNNGKFAIGTGPYTLKSYVKGTGIELERNENYWGTKPEWKTVKFVPVPSAGPRLTGLLSGDFDVIENPAARDLPRLKDGGFEYIATPSTRLVFFQLDIGRDTSPFVKAADGKNPLQDLRVRKAINMAIDRKVIQDRIMDGLSTPAYQYMPDGMFGALPNAPEIKYDPEGAKKLLAEAGYPDGFELTLSSTNNRYVNDGQVTQAVAQYLSRIGIKVHVDAMTASIYFPKRAKREFSFAMGGWPSETGEASALFQLWVASTDAPKSLGTSNYGGFSNAEFDKVYRQAIMTVDPVKREKLLQQATQIALDNVPLIPLHFESSVWGFRKGLTYEGRRDQYTLAMSVHQAAGK